MEPRAESEIAARRYGSPGGQSVVGRRPSPPRSQCRRPHRLPVRRGCLRGTEAPPSTPTGRKSNVPARRCFVSMFPPQREGGTVGARQLGRRDADRPRERAVREGRFPPRTARGPLLDRASEMRSHGSGYSSARSPKPGMIAVHPQSRGLNSRAPPRGRLRGGHPYKERSADGLTCEKSRLQDVLGARAGVNLLVGCVADVELDDVAWIAARAQARSSCPDVVERVATKVVDRSRVQVRLRPPKWVDPSHYRASLRDEQAPRAGRALPRATRHVGPDHPGQGRLVAFEARRPGRVATLTDRKGG